MNQSGQHVDTAWGLDLTGGVAHLVRLSRSAGGVRAESRQTFAADTFPQSGWLNGDLRTALAQIPPKEPLGVCFPDRAMLCRGFSLPSAPDEAMRKMVHAQAEALLSAGGDRLRWTWQRFDDPLHPGMRWILFCAARRQILEAISGALPPSVTLRILLPRFLASASACPPAMSSASQLLIELTDQTATMALWIDGHVLRCNVMDRGSGQQECPEGGPAEPEWMRGARQNFHALVEGLPRARWPDSGLIRGADGEVAKLRPDLGNMLEMDLRPWLDAADEQGSSEEAESYCGAIGAARLALEETAGANINFARQQEEGSVPASVRPRRLVAWAAAILTGVLVLYGIDCYRGWWLARQVEHVRVAEAASGGIQRRLGIERYLEKHAPPALAGLDAILTAAPPSLTMTSFGLTSSAQLHFSGAVQTPAELDAFLHKLQADKALMNVQLRSGRSQQRRWLVELSADMAPMAGLLVASGPKPPTGASASNGSSNPAEPHASPSATSRAMVSASQPSVQPASRRGGP